MSLQPGQDHEGAQGNAQMGGPFSLLATDRSLWY